MFRKHGRTSMRCPMLLKHQKLGVFEATTRDISASGIFIGPNPPAHEKILAEVNIGDELVAKIESLDNQNERLHLRVTRLAKDGFALKFV